MGDCARRAQSRGEWPGLRLTCREGFLGMDVAVGGGMRPPGEEAAAAAGRRFGMGRDARVGVGEALRGLVSEGMRPLRVGMRFVGGVGIRVAGGEGVLLRVVRVGMRRAGEEAGRGMPEVRGLSLDFGRGGGGMRSDAPLVGVAGPSRFSVGVDTVGGSGDVGLGATTCGTSIGWGASSLCSSTISGEAGGGSKLKAGGGVMLKEGSDGFSIVAMWLSSASVGIEMPGRTRLGTGSSLGAAVALGVDCSSSSCSFSSSTTST